MQKLLEPNTVPPDGYRAFQPETRTWVRAPDYFNFFVNVRDHRKANNIPLGAFWEAEVEDQLCQMLPPGFCKEVEPAASRRNIFGRLKWEDVVVGTETVASWATKGFQKVDQALADSRADVCSRCYYNVNIGGICGACQHLSNLTAKFVGGKKTSSEPFLKACAICKCSLSVKVWVPAESISAGNPKLSDFPDFCWIPKEVTNYRKNA
jgi:hypothetical protein